MACRRTGTTSITFIFINVYDFSNLYDYYLDDIDNIKEIIKKLDSLDKNSLGKTKSIAIEQLKKTLEEKLATLNREN